MKHIKKIKPSTVGIAAVLIIWGWIILYPFYNAIVISFMTEKEYLRTDFVLFPKEITLNAYKFVFSYSKILSGYASTLFLVLVGVPLNLFLTVTLAFALSRKEYPGKKFFNFIVIFTMYFSGGVIPTYLLVKNIGLINSMWSVVLTYGVNTYYMIIIKNYFSGIPESIEEAARIDGANPIQIMVKIFIPMSKPVLATFLLFFIVDRWNEWYRAMLYLTDAGKWPLQMVLREIIATTNSDMMEHVADLKQNFSMGVKMATLVVTMGPIMIMFPFLQKYFIKGMTAGAVKE